ncbi:Enoyl-CoA hydratase/carnithine racemase [Burkholderia sp. D7]|nr:Enoyl-CoA hydratase/carnithine racemase [Burkholderia sp. D7]
MANDPLVRYSNVNQCAVLTLDHAPVNSLSLGLRRDLAAALARAASDDQAQAIILIGAGKGFCAGGDLREFGTPDATAHPGVSADLHPAIERSAKPVIAAIHDIAMGGGLETALACHLRVASASARIGLPEVLRGTIPLSGTQRLPRLLSLEQSLDFIVSGRTATVAEFAGTPLFDRVVEDANVLDAALALARECVASGMLPVLVRKRAMAHKDAATCFADARLRVRDAAADNVAPSCAIDAIEAAVMCDDFDEGLAQARHIYESLMRSESVTRLRDRFFAERNSD